MNIGFLGLGKLGLPCALAIDLKGHNVMGYDINPAVMQRERVSYREQGPNGEPSIEPFLRNSRLRFASDVAELVDHSEIILVAIQTPHDERYEGITRLSAERRDFNYTWLLNGVKALSENIAKQRKDVVVTIISTVLPGTMRNRVYPIIQGGVSICYNPFFIAMGTTMRDFLHPEFVLLGVSDESAATRVEQFYRTMVSAPIFKTTVETAEMIKVAYNTFITMKIVFANILMEICQKMPGADVDAVTDALRLATTRIISSKYLSGGMGDGGGCHPRDNIALSWLARELHLSYDLFEALMAARESQTEWLADLMEEHSQQAGGPLPKVILGKSFKPESDITLGSPSILLKTLLEERGHTIEMYDPYVDKDLPRPRFVPSVFLIGTKHPDFVDFEFPEGSIVLDPWRYIPQREGVRIIGLGKSNSGVPAPRSFAPGVGSAAR